MTFARWKLETLDASDTYTFAMNPNAMAPPHPADGVSFTYTPNGYIGVRTPAQPVSWQFSGVLREQAQFDALVLWVTMHRTKVRLTTDLNEQLIVRLSGFTAERQASSRHVPWRRTYSMKALVYSYRSI